MPKSPEPEGSPRLLTIDQIAETHGVSRSSVHTYRRGGTFPRPVPVEGTTRVLFDADEVAAWFEANPKQQGRRTDLHSKKPKQGEPVTTTVDPRIAVLSGLSSPSWHPVPEAYGMPWDEAEEKLNAYRVSVLRDFLFRLEQSAGDAAAGKFLDDNPDLAALVRAEGSEES